MGAASIIDGVPTGDGDAVSQEAGLPTNINKSNNSVHKKR